MRRAVDLQVDAIDRLESTLSVPADNIIPVQMAARLDHLDPRVSAGAYHNSVGTNNRLQDVDATVRVVIDASESYVIDDASSGSLIDLKRLKSDVIDELTTDTSAWSASGLSSDSEIQWDDERSRFLGAVEFGFESSDTIHPNY